MAEFERAARSIDTRAAVGLLGFGNLVPAQPDTERTTRPIADTSNVEARLMAFPPRLSEQEETERAPRSKPNFSHFGWTVLPALRCLSWPSEESPWPSRIARERSKT